jgi:uridine kinase
MPLPSPRDSFNTYIRMFLVGIAGGSGSGKTTFAHKIMAAVNDPSVALLHQDSYYLASPNAALNREGAQNFDHPEAFDWALLKEQLRRLKRGEAVGMLPDQAPRAKVAGSTSSVGRPIR